MSDASLNEQLLTALFDGELSGEERELAERLLAENPQYNELADQWREQADSVRQLPQFKLDDGFAFRVMREVLVPKVSEVEQKAAFASNWKIGLAAIASLAAMLFLTLFVFPNIGNDTPVAQHSAETAPDDTDGSDNSVDEANGREMARPKSRGVDASANKEPGSEMLDSASGNDVDAGSGQMMSIQEEPGTSNRQARSGQDYPSERPGKSKAGRRPSIDEAGPGNLGVASNDSLNNRQSENSSEEKQDLNTTSTPDTEYGVASFGQVVIVEVPSNGRPLATVEDVLSRNAITIVESNYQDRSNSETLYNVVSTPSQMKQAILDLAKQSEISGYRLPSKDNLVQLAHQNKRQSDAGQKSAIVAGDAPPKIAAAQTVKSIRFNADAGSNAKAGGTPSRDEIEELDRWFGLSSGSDEDQLTQYLLFVRPTAAKESPEPTKPRSGRPKMEQFDQ